jgi:hypothetical protein
MSNCVNIEPDVTESAEVSYFYSLFGNLNRWMLAVLIFLFAWPAVAQQHYTTLKSGDYKVVEEDTRYLPGAQISGSYRAYFDSRREGILVGEETESKIQQDFELRFESRINTNISLHVAIENNSSSITEQETPYETKDLGEKGDSSGDGGLSLVFGEAYLEYNHNPNASLRMGRQPINIADRKGLIYEGTATAIRQSCRIGTWCYDLGGARIGPSGDYAVFWMQLDYPVFESGVLIKDPWGFKTTRQQKSLNVELFRVAHGAKDIPLADYGGWTGNNSIYHDTSDDTATGKRVFFDNDEVEYIGFNLKWNHYNFSLDWTWSNYAGSRVYHTGTQDAGFVEIGDRSVSGSAFYLDLSYLINENWRCNFTSFLATGDKLESDGEKIWQRDSTAYFEIKKGDFGDAIVYFNGRDNIGDGHSVSNLTYNSIGADYLSIQRDMGFSAHLYLFTHTNPVFINTAGADPETDVNIGNELDASIYWYLEEKLKFSLSAGMFQVGKAYARNDSLRPTENQGDFTVFSADVVYRF